VLPYSGIEVYGGTEGSNIQNVPIVNYVSQNLHSCEFRSVF